MAMSNQKSMISSEEARIMLLEQKNDDFHQTLLRIEKQLHEIDKKFEGKFDKLTEKVDSHFKWNLLLIFGLYATGFATLLGAVGKAYHWFQ